jgi:hypothetical protein
MSFTSFNFYLLCYIHMFIWIIIIFGFINKNLAYLNLKYFIPIIFIAHLLPFHILTKIKFKLDPNHTREKINKFEHDFLLSRLCLYMRDNIFKNCFQNPLSPQGLLILGGILSSWRIIYS